MNLETLTEQQGEYLALKKLSLVVQNTDNAVVITDNQGKIEWVNDSFTKLSKYTLEEAKGKKPGSLLQGKDTNPEDILALREKLKSGDSFEHTILNYSKEKEKYWLKLHISPVFDEENQLANFVAIQSDITQEKEAEAKLKQALKETKEAEEELRRSLEEREKLSTELMLADLKFKSKFKQENFIGDSLNKTKSLLEHTRGELKNKEKLASLGVMLAGIAHEINNPVSFISNGLGALKQATSDLIEVLAAFDDIIEGLDDEHRLKFEQVKEEFEVEEVVDEIPGLVDDIYLGVKKTTEITNGLRVFSRTDDEEKVEADIKSLTDSSLTILKSEYKHRVKINTRYDDSLGPIKCYPGPLSQVLVNLIKNGIQAIPEENKQGVIAISTESLGDQVRIVIEDNGKGIPKETQSRIFEPFYTTKGVGVGTGLGMSISKEIIEEKHGGEIKFESEEGQGTRFIITLPKK